MAPRTPRKISDLKAARYNPRDISPEALDGLKVSLGEFGDVSGIVWNSRTGRLVTGHQRLLGLKQQHGKRLEIRKGAVVTPDGEEFSIRVVDWPPDREKAANVAANSPELQGMFTPELGPLLEELEVDVPALYERLRLEEIDVPAAAKEKMPGKRGSRGERMVKIWCSDEELERIRKTVDRWAERPGVTVEIK